MNNCGIKHRKWTTKIPSLLKTSPTILLESRILQRGQDKNVIIYPTIQNSLRSLKQTIKNISGKASIN